MGKRYYDNYDYEEAYKEQCKKLEEAEMERWMKEGWVNCLYRTSTYKSTNTESNTTLLESMVYPSFKFKADMPKTEKKRETSPSQSNLNDKNARRYLIRLANITVTKSTGIGENDQLAYLRAMGVKDYIEKNIPALQKMKTSYDTYIEVSENKGGEYRRIGVKFTFINVF
jgi:hypothetical protein